MRNDLLIITDDNYCAFTDLANATYKITKQADNLLAEVITVSEEEILQLNKKFRNVDKVTDVLSFPTLDNVRGLTLKKENYINDIDEETGRLFIGSIAICKKIASNQAKEFGHSEERELTYLTCHGLLHLLGYDHILDEDKAEMRDLEEKIMKELKIFR